KPLAGEVRDDRIGLRIPQHPAHLPCKLALVLQRAALGYAQQLVVGNAAPEEEGQPRGKLEIAHRIPGTAGHAALLLEAEQELRARQDASNRHLNASVEPSLRAPLLPERKQHGQIRLAERAPIRAASEPREDPRRTVALLGCRRGATDEYPT